VITVNISHSPETFEPANDMFDSDPELANDFIFLTLFRGQRTVFCSGQEHFEH
jgi:hypothetical protein